MDGGSGDLGFTLWGPETPNLTFATRYKMGNPVELPGMESVR